MTSEEEKNNSPPPPGGRKYVISLTSPAFLLLFGFQLLIIFDQSNQTALFRAQDESKNKTALKSPVSIESSSVSDNRQLKEDKKIPSSSNSLRGTENGSTHDSAYVPVPSYAKQRFFSDPKGSHVARYLVKIGWSQIDNFQDAELVWYQKKDKVQWSELKPWQRVNHLTNENSISNKGVMIDTLAKKKGFPDFHFLPETYRLWKKNEREQFNKTVNEETKKAENLFKKNKKGNKNINVAKENNKKKERPEGKNHNVSLWTLKKPAVDGGKGISLLSTKNDLDNFQKNLKNRKELIQRYVNNPLLTEDGRKFELRVFWFVASSDPPLVFYRDPMLRISADVYKPGTLDLVSGPPKRQKAESSLQDSGFLEKILKKKYPNIKNPMGDVRCKIQHALTEIYARSRHVMGKDSPTENAFVLMGTDLILDEDLNLFVMENISGPGLPRDASDIMKNYVDKLVPELVDITLEVSGKQRAGSPIWPLDNVKGFELILDGSKLESKYGKKYNGSQLLSTGRRLPACSRETTNIRESLK